MKKKIISMAVMMTMALAMMPVSILHADEITLTGNKTLDADSTNNSFIISQGSTVTLNLNGHSIEYNGTEPAVINYGNLTIVDSTANSTDNYDGYTQNGNINSSKSLAIFNAPGATVTIESGNFFSGVSDIIRNLGTMTIKNGNYYASTNLAGSCVHNGFTSATESVTVNSNTYSAANGTTSTLTIDGGFYHSEYYDGKSGIWNGYNGKLTINDGRFNQIKTGVYNENIAFINGYSNNGVGFCTTCVSTGGDGTTGLVGTTTINGGNFYGDTYSVATKTVTATTNVYGGYLRGTIDQYVNSKIKLYGGTYFDKDGHKYDVSYYLASGSTFNDTNCSVTSVVVPTITKYVLFNSVPDNATFTYAITNDSNYEENAVIQSASTNGTTVSEEVHNGISPNLVKFNLTGTNTCTLNFNVDDYNNNASQTLPDGMTTTLTDPYQVNKSMMPDFSSVVYSNPGIYRYILTENISPSNEFTASETLYLDVWVARASADPSETAYDSYAPTAVIVHTGSSLTATKTTSTEVVNNKLSYLKSESTVTPLSLTVKHQSLGNQASRTDEYNYQIDLTNVTKGAKIYYKSSTGSSTQSFVASTTDTTATFNFTLKHDESITFLNIGAHPGYTITETDGTALINKGYAVATQIDNYKLSTDTSASTGTAPDKFTGETISSGEIDTTAETPIVQNDALADAIAAANSKTTITDSFMTANSTVVFSVYKEGTVPTGVILNVAPYAAVVVAGFFGLIIFAVKRKKDPAEQE